MTSSAVLPLELLAPAGGWEQLRDAVHFGANAVYLATQRYGMRKRADNFTEDELPEVVAFAHEHNVSVHVTVNIMMNDKDIDDLPRYFKLLDKAGVDAVIVSDLGALMIARTCAPRLAIHISTQVSCSNAATVDALVSLGATRVVPARELSLQAIKEMHERLGNKVEIEVFAHGAMCMAYSGRCLISDHLCARGANTGHCAQPCRWKYSLVEETRPGEYFPVIEEAGQSFILSSNDMNMIEHLPELVHAGVTSIKIEGRAKGAYYVACVINAYRHVLDGEDPKLWARELDQISHRPYSTGFYYGSPGQNTSKVEYNRPAQMVARVISARRRDDGEYDIELICRNRFFENETVTCVSALRPIEDLVISGLCWLPELGCDLKDFLRDEKGILLEEKYCSPLDVISHTCIKVNCANRTMERYLIRAPFALSPGDILRAQRDAVSQGRSL